MSQNAIGFLERTSLVCNAWLGIFSMTALLVVLEKIPQNFYPDGFDWNAYCACPTSNSSTGNSSSVSPQTIDNIRTGMEVFAFIGMALSIICTAFILKAKNWKTDDTQTISTPHYVFLFGACLLFGVCLASPLLIGQKLMVDVEVGEIANMTGLESLDAISISSTATWAVLTILSFIGMRVLASKQNKAPTIFANPNEGTALLNSYDVSSRYGINH